MQVQFLIGQLPDDQVQPLDPIGEQAGRQRLPVLQLPNLLIGQLDQV